MGQQSSRGHGDAQRASSVKPKKVSWLWRDRLPQGMIAVVAGKPDQGKGLFAAHVAAEVSQTGNVLYSAIEDDAGMMTRPRLEAAGANLDNVLLWRFTLPQQAEELEAHVIAQDIRLVVVDPFAAHLVGVSRHSDNIREVLTPLSGMAERTGCCVLIVEHALKRVSKDAHPLNAIGGSGSGLPAASRMAFVFGVDPADDERRILCTVKSNLCATPKPVAFEIDSEEIAIVGEVPSLVFQGECEFDARRLLQVESGDGKPGRRPDKRADACEWITNYLAAAGQPVPSKVVMEDGKHHGMTARTLRRAADDMGVIRHPAGGGPKCTWDLSPEVKQALGAGGSGE